jgi:hypothetical protein
MRPTPILAALAVALASVTVPTAARAAGDAPFVADGEIQFRASAAYDATRVRGPYVNMALTRDGQWGGNVLGKDMVVDVKPGRIAGSGINLKVTRDATSISVEGTVDAKRVVVQATKDSLRARVGNRQIECTRRPDGYWYLTGGATGIAAIRMKGSADRLPEVPMPQWIFAVIGAV